LRPAGSEGDRNRDQSNEQVSEMDLHGFLFASKAT